jgi:pimeloyl-ACP methyl ester carboxylesterase
MCRRFFQRTPFVATTLLLLITAAYAAMKPAPPPPCTSATPECTEWLTFGAGPARSLFYRNYSLATPNPSIHRALIMVHGTNRNADHYFQTATAAAFLAGALADTVVISPRFASADRSCKDTLATDEVNWSCGGDSWRSGGTSASNKDLTSFDFIDALLRKLADKRTFPDLTAIVIAGHSAGGQFVARYAMANHVHESLGVAITYVVANPSSYAWPDTTRPLPLNDATPEAAAAGWKSEQPHTNFRFGPFDSEKAPKYDQWPYGLENRTHGYTTGTSDDQLRKQLALRPGVPGVF